ncbi:phage tail tape measure protein [Alistipes sp. Z76]|nr:phage tail tape measure protein [Alistipes sp. Z76]NCE67032.1 phage tail tape measure protein [Muribaculaceae bacterium M3]
MENIDGALAFRATLDIDDFNVSAQAMENRIKDFSSSAIDKVESVKDVFQSFAKRAGEYISYYLVGQGMMGLLNSIVQVRGQFQQLEIAFETMLGSQSKAKTLMDQMVQTAAKTPFDLMGVAEGAKQLMAYGVSADKVNDTLVRLGNIASGLSIPLNDIVYLYGTTMVQGRLYAQDVRQFTGRGIPLVKELAEKYGVTADKINEMVSAGKIGFPEVEEVINKMTNAGGQFYNLMEKQSASLTGQISNLEDAWDTALNNLGEKGEGVFSTAISSATYLVEHMEDILRVLTAVTVAYGSYKAAVVLQTLVTKGYTGVALIDNTARSAKLALMKLDATLTGRVAAQTKAMTAAEEAHVAALQQQFTAEENANLVKQLRINAIQQLLTVQQQEYLSNLNITASNANYEAVAMGVLSVEQREALSKLDLTSKSAIYRAALEQEVAGKVANQNATLNAMRLSVKEAAAKLQAAKTTAIASTQAVEAARYEVYWAKQSGDATRIATAEKKLAGAIDNQSMTRKAALAAQTDFYTKKKQLETDATVQGRTAAIADAAATKAQAVTKGILATATNKATTAIKALWAACVSNPLTAILSLIGLVVSAFMLLDDTADDASKSMDAFGESGEKQAGHLSALFGVLQAGEKGTKTYSKALEEVNKKLAEYKLALLGEESTLQDIEDAHKRIEAAIKKENAERQRANSLNQLSEDYAKALDEIGGKIFNEMKGAHHYNAKWGLSFDSEDLQANAAALADQIRGVIEDKLPEMANLDPEKLEKAKAQLRQRITNILVDAGIDKEHAQFITDYSWLDDMYYDVFSEKGGIIDQAIEARKAFDSQCEAANKAADSVKKDSNAILDLSDSIEEVIPKVDLSKFSLEELHDMASKLDGKEVGLDIKVYGYQDAMQMLADINAQISGKQNNLNTENGINSEISNLKKLRGEAELGSEAWKTYNDQITTLEKKLSTATGKGSRGGRGGGRSGSNDAARNAETLLQKQLQAAKRLEEARIAIMEDGYEKRKALLDLQLKEQIEAINKEEKELANARKKAGKGGLTANETQGFADRRTLAEQSNQREQQALIIAEIAEKKKQYQLYWRWVENMGKDVADKQFATLLTSGASYKEFLDKQIQALKDKQTSGQTLTDGEQQQLFTLDLQVKEISGAKSAMDLFKDSVTRTINQAQTLAEKLEAIAAAKEELANGKSGLVSEDDIAAANLFLSQEDEKNQQELEDRVLTQFRTFEEQKTSIQNEYALLRAEAQRLNDEERIKQINQAENEALSALNSSFLMQSESWKNLFTDLDALTVEQIDKLVREIQDKLNTADLKLNPADLKAVLDKLDEAKSKILDVNPFKALSNSLTEVFKKQQDGSKKTSKQIKTDWKNLSKSTEACFDFVNDAIASCSVLDDLLGDSGKATMEMIQGVAMAGIAMSAAIKSAEKGSVILTAISIALQAISWIAGLFNNDEKIEKRIQNIQRNIDALSNSFDRMQHAAEQTYWVFTDEEKEAHEKRLNAIRDQIAALEQQAVVARQSWNFVEYARLTKQIKELKYALEKEGNKGDMFQLYEMQKQNLKEQQELIKQQIQAEKGKKKTDWDKIAEWEEAIKDIDTQLEDMERSMMETLAGTDTKSAIDEFADALVEAYCQGEDAAEALGAKTKEVLKNAVVEALKRQFLAKAIDEAIQFLGSAMEDGTLDPWEKSKFEAMVNAAGETFNNALEGIGDWIKDMDEAGEQEDDPLKGAIKGMSDQQADVLAGRANAIVINQSEMISIGRSSLVLQAQIVANTKATAEKLDAIHTTIKNMENNNSLLSQGIS